MWERGSRETRAVCRDAGTADAGSRVGAGVGACPSAVTTSPMALAEAQGRGPRPLPGTTASRPRPGRGAHFSTRHTSEESR
jgi:hypothetical protein